MREILSRISAAPPGVCETASAIGQILSALLQIRSAISEDQKGKPQISADESRIRSVISSAKSAAAVFELRHDDIR